MNRSLALIASLFALSAAGAAQAAPMTATLATPLTKEARIIAGGAAWRCAESTCVLSSAATPDARDACRQIVRQLGAVTAFGTFDAARLEKCNTK